MEKVNLKRSSKDRGDDKDGIERVMKRGKGNMEENAGSKFGFFNYFSSWAKEI